MRRERGFIGVVLLAVLVAVVLGCRQEVPPLFRRNRPPETTLTVVVEESTTSFYRYHVYWRGVDPDGEVVRYLFAITDTLATEEEDRWNPALAFDRERGTWTTKNDSVFLFDSGLGRQTFNIVALDDFGAMDPTPARQFFRVTDRGTPRVRFLAVRANKAGLVPCAPAAPCTVPMYTDFTVVFRGSTPNGFIQGVTWSADRGPFQPFNTDNDTTFLFLPPPPPLGAGMDTTVVGRTSIGTTDTLWTVRIDTVSAHYYSARLDSIPSGSFEYEVNVLDDARRSVIGRDGDRLITVNYDPQTWLHEVPECQCPGPPPNCDPQKMVPVGWLTGVNQTVFPMNEWRLFCPGDTLPQLARVTFYARGVDDDRDEPKAEGGALEPVQYRFRFEYRGPPENLNPFNNPNIKFSIPAKLAADLQLPEGGTFRGASASWRTCPFDYRFEAGSVDEQQRIDGTPAAIEFFVGHSPTIDSLLVPSVVVFVPNCGPIFGSFCDTPQQSEFGPDTLLVFGTHLEDQSGTTPFNIGRNEFVFPFRAWGRDHVGDKNPPGETWYTSTTVGRVRSWRYTFDCQTPLCQDLGVIGERAWRSDLKDPINDPPGQEVFDEPMRVTVDLDTFCVQNPCTQPTIRAFLKSSRFGNYEFTLQGRDTDVIGQKCDTPTDLGDNPGIFSLDISNQGRRTQLVSANTVWVQLRDVRPPHKPRLGAPFANRKRLMQ